MTPEEATRTNVGNQDREDLTSWAGGIIERIRSTAMTSAPRGSSSSFTSSSSISTTGGQRIPRTSPSRLAQAAQPDTAVPIPTPTTPSTGPPAPRTVLYLAYGSNLCSQTFRGTRGIKPLSQIAVSAPSLQLVFDLPGVPYVEPCFANTAIRKLPKLPLPEPPKFPPDVPMPHPPFSSATTTGRDARDQTIPGDAQWQSGLIGVVYEVTEADYAHILATEGGGASYADIVVPCLPLPARVGVPEKPDWPELPRMFVAHTLYAPRIPSPPPGDDTGDEDGEKDSPKDSGDDDDDDDGKWKPKLPRWAQRLLLPVVRPDGLYAQPSARYLKLIRDGAREHELPDEYQAYLSALKPYSITRPSQSVGMVLLCLMFGPAFLLIVYLSRVFADEKGKVPRWLAVFMAVLFNAVWSTYDGVFKPVFGDGERTEEIKSGKGEGRRVRRGSLLRRTSLLGKGKVVRDEEKRLLGIEDEDE